MIAPEGLARAQRAGAIFSDQLLVEMSILSGLASIFSIY